MNSAGRELLEPAFLARLGRLTLKARRLLHGDRQGEKRSRRIGSGMLFAGHRGYVSGDDLRKLDWDLLARLDRPFVKLLEEETDLTVHLLVDASRSMGFGAPSKFRAASRLAAALAYIALSSMDRVGVSLFDGSGARLHGPARGRAGLFPLLRFLGDGAPRGPGGLARGLRSHAVAARPGLTVVVSDFLDADVPEALLQHRYRRHDMVLVRVLSRQELEPDYEGDLRLIDAEGGEAVELTMGPRELEAYRARLEQHAETLRRFGMKHGVEVVEIPADLPLEAAVWDHLLQATFVGRR